MLGKLARFTDKMSIDKLVYKQVFSFLNKYKMMYKFQSGYRPSYSVQSALVKITDDIREAMDKTQLTVLMLLEFGRAFVTVHHKLLLLVP